MPSVQYMNNSAPFWDWVASLEQDGMNHPWFSQNQNQHGENERERSDEERTGRPSFGPWGWGFPGFGGRAFPHHGPPPHGHHGEGEEKDNENENREKEKEKGKDDDKNMEDANDKGEGPSGSGSETEGRRGHGRCGPRRGRHGCGGPRGFGGPGRHGHHHGRRGGFGPWGRGGFGPAFDPFAFASSFLDPQSTNKDENADFTPEADIFDTPTSFVVHVSLPGAKKEDVGVNWDAEKSELSIAGVIYRPGDEEFLKTLAIDERKVGPFERKVRLGTRANPAVIDADGISAKLEDGVLRVEVPKLGDNGFVEVRKVDIE
ncbi:HSP20-like chaperone [Bimuria novae-zelandiae CBS 107.79]|uniref:HSP20-like chaperone n=1 Tax=Bimuria novae-zelandiae CBS 107.79 TaxID=1447943 RepID=A0A6A5VSJ8_9PLEO|nr:HSP20-like chaperone [Bimuria novae-zelandiae CBS 107.79]